MLFPWLSPVILSAVVLAAHFLRAGNLPLTLACLALPLLLLVRRPWTPRIVQFALFLGALEWVRTTVELVRERQAEGAEWERLALILGAVVVLTLASAFVFENRRVREHYSL